MVYVGYDDMQLCQHLRNYSACQPWTAYSVAPQEAVTASAVVTTYSVSQTMSILTLRLPD